MRELRPLMAILVLLLPTAPGAADDLESGDWTLAKREDGIEVHTREVPGSVYKEFRAAAVVPAPLTQVVGWYIDPATYTAWIDSCVEARRVGDGSPATTYFKFDFPFPASDRDVVLRTRRVEDGASRVVFEGEQADGVVPESDGLVRIRMLRSRWEFRARGDGTTEVLYRQHMDAGGSLPAFILNRAAVDNPYATLRGLARYAERHRTP